MKTENNLTSAVADAATIAKYVGLTPKRISQLASENKIPSPDMAGQFPLAATVAQYCDFLRARADVATVTSAKRRKLQAQAEIAEMDLATKRKELVKLSDVERVWTAAIISAREIICQSAMTRKEQDEVLELLANADHKQNLQKANA
jgi:hypothetical protein